MHLLSFDIGIKNLAFSLVELQITSSKHVEIRTIVDWGIVNLIADSSQNDICVSKPPCKNKACRCIGKGDNKIIICKNKRCGNWAETYWKQTYPKSKASIQTYKRKKATQYSLIDIASSIKLWLQTKMEDWNNISIDRVLLEHQPVFRNPVMKSVEMILVGVLVGTGFSTSIDFVHAARKTKSSDNYSERKQLSIDAMEEIMKQSPQLFPPVIKKTWESSKKRDDLADTVNQALAWMKIHKT